jgi:hypothetical protein
MNSEKYDWFKIEPNDRFNFVGDTERNPKGHCSAHVFVGVGGDIVLVSESGMRDVFKNVPNGWTSPMPCVRVHDTGTTATDIVGIVFKKKEE